MNRQGFAVITVLWMVAALGATAALTLARARVGSHASANRVLLARAEWAREACTEIIRSEFAQDSTVRGLDTIELGRDSWCVARLEDSGARLSLNAADPGTLRLVVRYARGVARQPIDPSQLDSLVDAVIDWRDADDLSRPAGAETEWYERHHRRPPRNGPFSAANELQYVRGFDDQLLAAMAPLITTRGTGRINVNAASAAVLRSLAVLDPRTVDRLVRSRRAGRVFRGHAELAEFAAEADPGMGVDPYRLLVQQTVLAPQRLVAVVEGGVGSSRLVSRVTITFIPTGSRLAIARRESS